MYLALWRMAYAVKQKKKNRTKMAEAGISR